MDAAWGFLPRSYRCMRLVRSLGSPCALLGVTGHHDGRSLVASNRKLLPCPCVSRSASAGKDDTSVVGFISRNRLFDLRASSSNSARLGTAPARSVVVMWHRDGARVIRPGHDDLAYTTVMDDAGPAGRRNCLPVSGRRAFRYKPGFTREEPASGSGGAGVRQLWTPVRAATLAPPDLVEISTEPAGRELLDYFRDLVEAKRRALRPVRGRRGQRQCLPSGDRVAFSVSCWLRVLSPSPMGRIWRRSDLRAMRCSGAP